MGGGGFTYKESGVKGREGRPTPGSLYSFSLALSASLSLSEIHKPSAAHNLAQSKPAIDSIFGHKVVVLNVNEGSYG